jgi:hypothetical protein
LGIQIILQIWSHSVSLYLIPTLNDVPEKSERNSEVPIIRVIVISGVQGDRRMAYPVD